jgi:hypothetical protein
MKRSLSGLLALAFAGALVTGCDGGSPTSPRSAAAPRFLCHGANDSTECGPNVGGGGGDPGGSTPPAAGFDYASDIVTTTAGTSLNPQKAVYPRSQSRSFSNVASSSVDAHFYISQACSPNGFAEFDHRSASGTGSPLTLLVGSSASYPTNQVWGFRVAATHTFTAAAGATGGGTFSSSWAVCY